ncbi:hypothetical protein I7I51_08620 [Histoplasma capsulatum]|uniref:Uncharacterized protein n=1 Tax=Ajellomyces capsulatus TaxID=5037 RepID=A0A8A1LYC7_AJECA|nr:hypothetical protein I7I51_08620 [Histoplasma capsulatum]
MSLVVVWNTACRGQSYIRMRDELGEPCRRPRGNEQTMINSTLGGARSRRNRCREAERPGTKEAGKIAISRLSLGKEGALQGGLVVGEERHTRIHRLKPHQHVPSNWLLYCTTIERCDEKGPRIGFHGDARAPLRQLDVNFFAQSQSANQKISMDPNLLLNCFSNVLAVEVEASSPHLVDED